METSSKELYKYVTEYKFFVFFMLIFLHFFLFFRSIFTLVKCLDEEKQKFRSVHEIFNEEFQQKRQKLVQLCQQLVLSDFDTASGVGKKARDILWRKGYYDIISLSKHIFAKTKANDGQSQVETLIFEGISVFKTIILKLEHEFDLDLKDTIDMTIIKSPATFETGKIHESEHHTMSEISYAWDVIHASLISIGDLYRYLLGFKSFPDEITVDSVAAFYHEAFKLNPTIGMPHNQLGTLYSGKNYEIDSIFHYLYAILCKIPFDLSEGNVNKIFQKNAIFLESDESNGNMSDPETKMKYFIARFILVVDIFFYDKEITDFTDLCHSILIEIKYLLDGSDQGRLTEEILFKMTSILLFCLHKLKLNGSKKIHSLNAVLVALASELVDKCNLSIMQFISGKEMQNIVFYDKYNRIFTKFENFVRDVKKNGHKEEEVQPTIMAHTASPVIFVEPGGSDDKNSSSNKENNKIEKKSKELKKVNPRHRRRRPQLSNGSETQSSSDEENDDDDVDLEDSDAESFSSYNSDDSSVESDWSDEEENVENVKNQSKFDEDSDSGDDIIVLEEEIIYPNDETDSITSDPFKSNSVFDTKENVLSELLVKFEALSGVKYRNAYRKVDPNIILEYCAKEKCLKALKVLFDWMYLNPDIVVGCYVSNPEFIHKIMRFINFVNIDIFTRKIYFDRCFITNPHLRTDLRYLFDIRGTIPIEEDEQLKKFVMFENVQQNIDWELSSKLKITKQEMIFLRLFKLIDYGFHLSKMRKFHYYFCAKDRVFIERNNKKSREMTRDKDRASRRNRNGRDRPRNENRRNRRARRREKRNQEAVVETTTPTIAKRYLKNKLDQNAENEITKSEVNIANGIEGKSTSEKMAALWLHNEVSSLENKVS